MVQTIASLSAIQYELGEFRNIDELDFLVNDPEKLELFRSSGLLHYAESELSLMELCSRAVTRTLDTATVDRKAIDFVLFVAENANTDFSLGIRQVNNLLTQLGLDHALPVSIGLSDCANILTGIQMGVSLVAAKTARNVLLVCADRILREPGKREMARQMSVLSDGAVSCVLSEPAAGDFDVGLITHHNKPSQWELWNTVSEYENIYSMEKFKQLVTVGKRSLRQHGVQPKDIKKVITGNYRESISKMFIEITGFLPEQGYFDNIPRFGHTLAGDVLINLKDYADQAQLSPGEKIFTLVDSYSSCGSFLLVKT
ncbi:MAG TPA: 3-oxoacyl-[acyl-carrier-protein] synthase III C-terminal domain-containing protein [Flavisolibacter sp.]|jgi:3-oxoacyl-[acyl-carrier-protein] synthase III